MLFNYLDMTFKKVKAWSNSNLFGKEGSSLRSNYVCPGCGSDNWKFPNPLKPSSFFLNIPSSLVNTLFECKDCGRVGTFFAIDARKKIKKLRKQPEIDSKKFLFSYFDNMILVTVGLVLWITLGLEFVAIFLLCILLLRGIKKFIKH